MRLDNAGKSASPWVCLVVAGFCFFVIYRSRVFLTVPVWLGYSEATGEIVRKYLGPGVRKGASPYRLTFRAVAPECSGDAQVTKAQYDAAQSGDSVGLYQKNDHCVLQFDMRFTWRPLISLALFIIGSVNVGVFLRYLYSNDVPSIGNYLEFKKLKDE